jgi:hypothetical protein
MRLLVDCHCVPRQRFIITLFRKKYGCQKLAGVASKFGFFEKNSTFFNQNSQKVYSISHFTKIIIFHHLDGRLGKLVG